MREDRGTFSLLCSFSLSSLPFYGLPHRLLCIMFLLPQNMFLGVSSACYHDHQIQRRLMVDGVMNKRTKTFHCCYLCFYFLCHIINTFWKFLWLVNLAQDFFGVKFWSLNSFWILFEALGILGVLFLPPFNYPCHFKSRVLPHP